MDGGRPGRCAGEDGSGENDGQKPPEKDRVGAFEEQGEERAGQERLGQADAGASQHCPVGHRTKAPVPRHPAVPPR